MINTKALKNTLIAFAVVSAAISGGVIYGAYEFQTAPKPFSDQEPTTYREQFEQSADRSGVGGIFDFYESKVEPGFEYVVKEVTGEDKTQ